jgi:hypothetical protein
MTITAPRPASALPPPVKLLWLQALLSGAYPQGKSRLRNQDRYCCLGVLCDVSPKGTWTTTSLGATFDHRLMAPPATVLAWAGLATEDMHMLMNMNDNGRSFRKIARWIDEHL